MNLKTVGKSAQLTFEMYKEIFSANREALKTLKANIAEKQYDVKGTPNYFYRGKVHIVDRSYNIPPLHKSLRGLAQSYITMLRQYEHDTRVFNTYATQASQGMQHETDVFFLYPNSVHKFFSVLEKPDTEPDYIDQIKPSNYEEVELIITDQLMFSLMN